MQHMTEKLMPFQLDEKKIVVEPFNSTIYFNQSVIKNFDQLDFGIE